MSPLVKRLFLQFMPRVLMMRRTKYTLPDYDDTIHTNEVDMRWIMNNKLSTSYSNVFIGKLYRDHYRDSITEYPNEYKDNHEGYDNMGHPNHQHQHQQGKLFIIIISSLHKLPHELNLQQSLNKLSYLEPWHQKFLQLSNRFASSPSTSKIRIEIMRWVVCCMTFDFFSSHPSSREMERKTCQFMQKLMIMFLLLTRLLKRAKASHDFGRVFVCESELNKRSVW